MKFRFATVAALALITLPFTLIGCSTPQPTTEQTNNAQTNINAASVFTLTTYDAQQQSIQQSQAFAVEANGFLLTSYQGLLTSSKNALAQDIRIQPIDGSSSSQAVTVVAVEPTLNFAILQTRQKHALNPVTTVKQEELEHGIPVYALSGVNSEGNLLVSGELEGLNVKECYQESMTATMLEAKIALTDAFIGGPIFDQQGRVIAMHTGYKPANHFSPFVKEEYILPIFLAFNIYDSIKKEKSYISPWTGFSVRPLNKQENKQFPIKHLQGGIAIEYVWPNSPAATLGIQVNDILAKFDFYPTPSPAEFQKWLYAYGVGETVKLTLVRDGKPIELSYTIEQRPTWAVPK